MRLCVQEGKSGSQAGSPGFGLYGCAEIAKNSGGELIIISRDKKLQLGEGNVDGNVDILSCLDFHGTMVELTIPRNIDIDLTEVFGKNSITATEDIDFLIGEFDE